MRAMVGLVLGLLARLWVSTLRVTFAGALDATDAAGPWVFAFFHGTQFPLLALHRRRRRPLVALVSLSADGAVQARALSVMGLRIVRGSSSRGGARGLAALLRRLRAGDEDAAFAVDGPRGPYGLPKPGVLAAARRGKAGLVPLGSAMRHGVVFARAWDRFALPWPFSRVAVVVGDPLPATATPQELAAAIAAANAAAGASLAYP